MPRDLPSTPPPSSGPAVRLVVLGTLLAGLVYVVLFWTPPELPPPARPLPPPAVELPEPDPQQLREVRDDTPEDRRQLPKEPLRHLLLKAAAVTPAAAASLGADAVEPGLDDLRADRAVRRGSWLAFTGTLADLQGPQAGHPVPGRSLFAACVRLADGGTVQLLFDEPCEPPPAAGARVRAEGFFLCLRDLAYPAAIAQVPVLVGPRLLRALPPWPPQDHLDPTVFATLRDGPLPAGGFDLDAHAALEDSMQEPLWRLAAFALGPGGALSPAAWRAQPALATPAQLEALLAGRGERGAPMRLLGTLLQMRTVAAPPNPAGIRACTEAWLQVPELPGRAVAVWLPSALAPLPAGTALEVRARWFRRLVYATRAGGDANTCVFVATALDRFVPTAHPMEAWLGRGLGAATAVLVLGLAWVVHRDRRRARAFADHLADRRRSRRVPANSP